MAKFYKAMFIGFTGSNYTHEHILRIREQDYVRDRDGSMTDKVNTSRYRNLLPNIEGVTWVLYKAASGRDDQGAEEELYMGSSELRKRPGQITRTESRLEPAA